MGQMSKDKAIKLIYAYKENFMIKPDLRTSNRLFRKRCTERTVVDMLVKDIINNDYIDPVESVRQDYFKFKKWSCIKVNDEHTKESFLDGENVARDILDMLETYETDRRYYYE